jgi:CRP-like cAMP-binding protein
MNRFQTLLSNSTCAATASCAAFQDSGDIFLDSMAVLLREVNMSSDQYLYRVNEVSRELYVVSSGVVELTVEDTVNGGDTVISIRQRVGPGGLCSPRHRLQFTSRNEGLKYG